MHLTTFLSGICATSALALALPKVFHPAEADRSLSWNGSATGSLHHNRAKRQLSPPTDQKEPPTAVLADYPHIPLSTSTPVIHINGKRYLTSPPGEEGPSPSMPMATGTATGTSAAPMSTGTAVPGVPGMEAPSLPPPETPPYANGTASSGPTRTNARMIRRSLR